MGRLMWWSECVSQNGSFPCTFHSLFRQNPLPLVDLWDVKPPPLITNPPLPTTVWGTRTFSPLPALCSFLGSLLKIFWISWFCLSLSHILSLNFFSFSSEFWENFASLSGRLNYHWKKLLSPLCSFLSLISPSSILYYYFSPVSPLLLLIVTTLFPSTLFFYLPKDF